MRQQSEIPANLCCITKITEAATVNVIKILASHNPKIRTRYDRFDVATAFRPCSEIYFDPIHVRTATNTVTLNQNYREENNAVLCSNKTTSCSKVWISGSAAADDQANSKDVAAKKNSPRVSAALHTAGKNRHFEAVTDINEPQRRLLSRLLGCLVTSES